MSLAALIMYVCMYVLHLTQWRQTSCGSTEGHSWTYRALDLEKKTQTEHETSPLASSMPLLVSLASTGLYPAATFIIRAMPPALNLRL